MNDAYFVNKHHYVMLMLPIGILLDIERSYDSN
jgi:hypothetical protein